MNSKYETVIGLEVHVQLNTKTKIFCGCANVFGSEPNTNVCPVCLGLPGVLPVLNRKIFESAIKVALAIGCDIQGVVKFDRKNYYYPDLPKNYQISQYDMPIAYDGRIKITCEGEDERDIGITRVHMEEDAGKLIHDPVKPYSYVDLNRTGTPLLEIVSEPDMNSPEEAYQYLTLLKQTVKYLDVSDCNMEEGSLRCDANVSIREKGQTELGSKVEIKNLNSFKAVRDSIAFEVDRQQDVLEDGKRVAQQTRLWDEEKGITTSMRSKEETQDYRYFPEPDLVPFEIRSGLVEDIREHLPELPYDKRRRFSAQYELSDKDVETLISERELADFYENVVAECGDPRVVANWVKGEVLMHMKERAKDIRTLGLTSQSLAKIIKLTSDDTISGLASKDVLKIHLNTGKAPEVIVEEKGLKQVSDEGALEKIVDKVVVNNEKSVNDYRAGKDNALSFLVGQVMKESKGKANPKIAGQMLQKKIKNSV